jgi:hypothetical protein
MKTPADPVPFRLEYELANDRVVLRAWPSGARRARLVLPFLCSSDGPARRIEGGVEIDKPGGRLRVTWNAPRGVGRPAARPRAAGAESRRGGPLASAGAIDVIISI